MRREWQKSRPATGAWEGRPTLLHQRQRLRFIPADKLEAEGYGYLRNIMS